MGTCIKIFIFCYFIILSHYAYAFDHVTIVNEDSIDKEFDNVYRKNLFQPTSYLNAAMEPCINILELCIKVFTHTT